MKMLLRCIVVLCMVGIAGCNSDEEPKMEYGRVVGESGGKSLNGTGAFANIVRSLGHTVHRKTRITPRLDRYDTIIWFPRAYHHPRLEPAVWMENWLGRHSDRTLIYVARGYQSDREYWQRLIEKSDSENEERARRYLAEAILEHRDGQFNHALFFDDDNDASGRWFSRMEAADNARLDGDEIDGPWTDGGDSDSMNLEARTRLEMPDSLNDYELTESEGVEYDSFQQMDLETRPLLSIDGEPFAFEIRTDDSESRIIVISNASFLLNFPLVNPQHRQLALSVARECDGDVVFLETEIYGAQISNRDDSSTSAWAWIAHAPMIYIVPHLMFWGLLFCFANFPVFGNPRRVRFSAEKKFRHHIDACGRLLKQVGGKKRRSWAIDKIENQRKNQTREHG